MAPAGKTVMVFGSFDGLHEGHKAFVAAARALGDYLIVVVAQDHIIKHLKGELPRVNLADRFSELHKLDGVDQVVIGDAELSSWEVVKKYRPDIVAVGSDQNLLKEDLEKHLSRLGVSPEIKSLPFYEVKSE